MNIQSKSFLILKILSPICRHCHAEIKTNGPAPKPRSCWKSVIGLEIHAQLSTKTKLFSSAPAVYGAPTNSAVTLFDAAIPGTLPVLNKTAVKLAVLSSLALGCRVNPISYFDRKHYFYSDLPAGYQITQQHLPLAQNGKVEFAIYQPGVHEKPYYKTCGVKQIHLEQDSGKSLHEISEKQSYIDLNRVGVALIEIVFEPQIENEYEASALVKEVITILERIGSCTCKLEEGALRIDVNVSVKKDEDKLGVRTEIKNIGSIHGVCHAIKYETNRQIDLINNGEEIKSETLVWDSVLNKTIIMRDKEEKQDYRFMPEPNLPPLRLLIDEYSENVHKNIKSKGSIINFRHLKEKIPALPQHERVFLMEKFGLSDTFAYNLVNQKKLLDWFKLIMLENTIRDSKITYILLMYQLLNALKCKNLQLEDCTIAAGHLGQIVDLLQTRRISKHTSYHLVEELLDKDNSLSPFEIVEKKNLKIISSPKELRKICLRIIEREDVAVSLYKRKKKKTAFNDLMKKVIEESNFRADTQVLPKVLIETLDDIEREK